MMVLPAKGVAKHPERKNPNNGQKCAGGADWQVQRKNISWVIYINYKYTLSCISDWVKKNHAGAVDLPSVVLRLVGVGPTTRARLPGVPT